ncbi:general secretion pathway protein GspB [Pontiella desulfatans]|nr:general secretion pathway protein GspB [Pontiella desulfatans]
MDWQPIAVNVLIGTLVPGVVLWLIGKKVQYDFEFWKLLLITSSAALVKQIPFGGIWISIPVYYILFCLQTGIDYLEAMWMTFLAFLVYAAAGFLLMMVAGSLWANHLDEVLAEEPAMEVVAPFEAEPQEPPKPTLAKKPPPAPAPPKPLANAPEWLREKYTVSGIAESRGERRAIINGSIVPEGEELEPGVILQRIGMNHVVIRTGNTSYQLDIRTGIPAQ